MIEAYDVRIVDTIQEAMRQALILQEKHPRARMVGNIVKIKGKYHVGVGEFAISGRTLSDEDLEEMQKIFTASMDKVNNDRKMTD